MKPYDANPPLRLDRENPWPGLSPFDEADSAFFHGRQVEAAELLSLIQLEGLTVLFGRSGLGKTSLLKAGVFPALRADNCLPVYLRLDHAPNAPSLRKQVLDELHAACVAHEVDDGVPVDSNVPDVTDAATTADSLWTQFHRRESEFWSHDNRLLTPVIVLDQFEEIFTIGQEADAARARSAAFLQELADLVENRPPPAVKAALAQDAEAANRYHFGQATVKLVLSFREDFLAQMEDLKRVMPALMVNRLRLLPMDGAQAYAVVTESGGELVDDEVARCILRLSWKNEPQPPVLPEDFARMEIDPALLSVVCSELNQKRQQARQAQITQELLAGADREILSSFYARSMQGLDQRVRAFVEDELLTDKGYRDSHDWDDALALPGVGRDAVAALVARRLLRVDERGGQKRLELAHDVLTRVVKDSRDQRRAREAEEAAKAREQAAREQQRRNRRNALLIGLGVLFMLVLAGVAAWQAMLARDAGKVAVQKGHEAELARLAADKSRVEAQAQQSRADAATAQAKIEQDRAGQALADAATATQRAEYAKQEALRFGELAKQQKAKADQLLLAAQSTRLMASADRTQDSQYDLSLLLNLEALRVKQTPDAHAGLLRRFIRHPHLVRFFGHEERVLKAVFSPDGKLLASASGDTVLLWDVASGKALTTLAGHKGFVSSISFSPDGRQIASGSMDDTVRLWDVASGKVLVTLAGHKASSKALATLFAQKASGIAFSPDGKLIATGSWDNKVWLWDVANGKALATLAGHKDSVNSVAFSPDGKQIVSGSRDRTVRLWDVANGKALATLIGHKEGVSSVVFSLDGERIASGSSDNTVLLWDVASGKALATLAGHKDRVSSVASSPDGKQIASGSSDNTVRLWDAVSGNALVTLAGHKDGSRPGPFDSIKFGVNSVSFNPDGTRLASGGDDKTILVWDLASSKATTKLAGCEAWGKSIAVSPDGKWIACGSDDKSVQLRDVANGKALATLSGHKDWVYGIAFSPDGKRIATGSRDNTVRLWDMASGKALATLTGHKNWVGSVAFNPDGKLIATGSLDETVLLWQVASGKALATLAGHKDGVQSVAFSSDGKRLAVGSSDGTVRLWDVASGKMLATLAGHKEGVSSVAFSPDGKRIASASWDSTVRLWDVASGKVQAVLAGHMSPVARVAFSPDGQRLASGSENGAVILWDISIPTPTNLAALEVNMGGISSLAFSPDGKQLAIGGNNSTIHLLNLDPAYLSAEACRTANRNLTCAEWKQHIGPDTPYRKTCEALPAPEACR